MTTQIATNVTTNTTTTGVAVNTGGPAEVTFQLKATAAVTVTLQGSADGTNWITIDTFTATGGKIIAYFSLYRITTAGNAGAVDAWINHAGN